jgi:PAS domain S-box-containing protein
MREGDGMHTRLRRIIAPLPSSEENTARIATLLTTILCVSLIVCVCYLLILLLVAPNVGYVVFVGGMCFILLLLLVAVRRGHVVMASWLFSIGAMTGMLLATYAFGGVRSSSYSALVLTVIIAGILLSGRAAAIVAALSIGLGWLMMQAELAGWYQSNPDHLSLFNTWIGQALSFVVAAVLLSLTVRSMRQALALARESQEALAHSNLTLQSRTLELEQERSALQQERDFVARLMDTSPAGIVRIDRDGRISFANASAEQILGLARSEITQRTYDAPAWRIMDLTGAPLPADQLPAARVMATGQAQFGVQHAIEWPDHRRILLSVNAAPVFDETGRLDGVVATVDDITNRKQTEGMLKRRARQLQTAAEVSRAMASILDLAELLPRVVELVHTGFDLCYVGLFLNDEADHETVLCAATGEAGRAMLAAGYRLRIDEQSMIGWCVTHGQARIALDVGADSVRFDNPLLPATRSEMALPLISRGEVIGAVSIQSDQPTAFSDDDVAALQTMTDQFAIAIENARLFKMMQQRVDELKVLHTVARAATEAITAEEMIEQAMTEIGRTLLPDYFGVLLVDETLQALRLDRHWAGAHVRSPHRLIALGQGVTGRVAQTGRAWRIADVRREPAYLEFNSDVLSELCVPLKVGDRISGVINMESRRLAAFSEADERLLSTVAGQLGTAIERLRAEAARRENEEALARERNLLRTLIDNLPEVNVFVKDAQGRFLTTNAAHLKMFGLDQVEDVVGKTDFDLLPREYAEQYYADEQAVLQAGRPMLNREEPAPAYDGYVHWYLTHKVPLRDRQGSIIGLVGMSLDITVRKRAEEREQIIARALRGVLAAADELIGLADVDQFYRRAVELAREKLEVERCGIFLLDAEQDKLRGTFGTDLDGQTVDEHANVITTDMHHQLLLPGAPLWLKREDRYQYWDGAAIRHADVGWVAATSLRAGDQPIGVFFNDNAISHASLDEARQEAIAIYCSLLGSMLELKRVTQERESLIAELETKNAELERFTYTVSHDLKSPLITIRGFLGFLEKDATSGNLERLHADVVRIGDATDRMQHLLNDLLELSRVGRLMNAPEDVPFAEIAREAVALVQGRIMTRGVRVTMTSGLPHVFGDRARLLEVMQNLVDNAVKFMADQADPHIEIGVRYDNTQPIFFVKDNGVGIDSRFQDKVFGLFDKLDPKSEGTGIGLALVKRIITAHGGRVWIESAGPGTGTTFCFTLPEAVRAD